MVVALLLLLLTFLLQHSDMTHFSDTTSYSRRTLKNLREKERGQEQW